MSSRAELSALLEAVLLEIETTRGVRPVTEYRFHPIRKWRFDVAFPSVKIAAEIDGGVWTAGRHTRGAGFIKDQEKTNAAALLGWRVFRFTWRDVEKGSFKEILLAALE